MKILNLLAASLVFANPSFGASAISSNPLDDPSVIAALLAAARANNPIATTVLSPDPNGATTNSSSPGGNLDALREILRGNEGGHGGDPYALEFSDIAKAIGTQILNGNANIRASLEGAKLNIEVWQKTLKVVRILSADQDEVVLRGAIVDAINFPDLTAILVNRNRWREADLTERVRLVLHEFLGLLAIEQDRYDVSTNLGDLVQGTVRYLRGISSSNPLMTNLFFGQCLAFPAVGTTDICDQRDAAITQAEDCSKVQAFGHCKVDGQSSCQIVSTSYRVVISPVTVGVRYCEVLTILK